MTAEGNVADTGIVEEAKQLIDEKKPQIGLKHSKY
jgi:hypothetical protein